MYSILSEVNKIEYKTYLKVREVLHYDILTRGAHNCLRSPPDWRRMMGLELFGQKSKSDNETRESRLRKKLRVDLQNVASSAPALSIVSASFCASVSITHAASQSFDSSNLTTTSPAWKGKIYESLLPDDICREILEEIFRLSFKYEFLLLDRYLYDVRPRDLIPEEGEVVSDLDASTREERNIKVIGAMMLDTEILGFTAGDINTRREAYLGFYNVMKNWNHYRTSPMSDSIHRHAEQLTGSLTLVELNSIEYYLAYYYISSFAKFFKRPPILPYRL